MKDTDATLGEPSPWPQERLNALLQAVADLFWHYGISFSQFEMSEQGFNAFRDALLPEHRFQYKDTPNSVVFARFAVIAKEKP